MLIAVRFIALLFLVPCFILGLMRWAKTVYFFLLDRPCLGLDEFNCALVAILETLAVVAAVAYGMNDWDGSGGLIVVCLGGAVTIRGIAYVLNNWLKILAWFIDEFNSGSGCGPKS